MRLGIRCDVGQSVGVGHLMRCIALAEEFTRHGWTVEIAAEMSEVSLASRRIADAGLDTVAVPMTVADHLKWVAASALDAVLLDSYRLEPGVSRELMRHVPVLALIDGSARGQTASLYVDQNFGAQDLPWPPKSPPNSQAAPRLAGSDFAILGSSILTFRPKEPERQSNPARLLVALGGTDAAGLTGLVVSAVEAAGLPVDVTVISGEQGSTRLPEDSGFRVAFQNPTTDFPKLLSQASAVVFAAGSSLWEAACLGKPIAALAVAQNQSSTYGGLVTAGLIHGLGDVTLQPVTAAELGGRIRNFLADYQLRQALSQRGFDTIDGLGRSRIFKEFETLYNSGAR